MPAAVDPDVYISQRLSALLVEHQVTQRALAAVLGVHQTTLSKKLRGLYGWSAGEIIALCEVFDVDPAYFLVIRSKRARVRLPKDLSTQRRVSAVRAAAP